jgi:hypothetical protein
MHEFDGLELQILRCCRRRHVQHPWLHRQPQPSIQLGSEPGRRVVHFPRSRLHVVKCVQLCAQCHTKRWLVHLAVHGTILQFQLLRVCISRPKNRHA